MGRMDLPLASDEITISFSKVAGSSVRIELRHDIDEWCREHLGPVMVVARRVPSYGFALQGADVDLLAFRLCWR